MYTYHYQSPLGGITMAGDGAALTGLWFDGQKYFGAGLPENSLVREDLPVFHETVRWLDLYFQGRSPGFAPPLRLEGSPFRRRVWELLTEIPYGQTTTYGEISRALAAEDGPMSPQAVGGAVGHNPVSLIVPCHRVVGSNGSLTGYAGGIGKKIALLQLEGVDLSRFSVPRRGTAL